MSLSASTSTYHKRHAPHRSIRGVSTRAGMYLLIALLPARVLAQNYQPLAPLPFIETTNISLGTYLENIFVFGIVIAAFGAVIKIFISGYKYMLSDSVSNKSEAKSDIAGALGGLILAIGSVLILGTLDSRLVSFDLSLDPVTLGTNSSHTPGGNSGPPSTVVAEGDACGQHQTCESGTFCGGGRPIRIGAGFSSVTCYLPSPIGTCRPPANECPEDNLPTCGTDESGWHCAYNRSCDLLAPVSTLTHASATDACGSPAYTTLNACLRSLRRCHPTR